jgi:hypothetical protein
LVSLLLSALEVRVGKKVPGSFLRWWSSKKKEGEVGKAHLEEWILSLVCSPTSPFGLI